jgi:hypothetical protein
VILDQQFAITPGQVVHLDDSQRGYHDVLMRTTLTNDPDAKPKHQVFSSKLATEIDKLSFNRLADELEVENRFLLCSLPQSASLRSFPSAGNKAKMTACEG